MLPEDPTNRPPGLFRQADWVIVVFLAVMYSATLTADYYWDGVTFALQIEKVAKAERGAALLFHQNHLIYNGFGYVLYRITQALGFSIRALQVLQIANAIAGAIAVGVFYRLAEHVTRNRAVAILSAAAMAFSAVWWKLATDANAYVISILLILVCVCALLARKPSWIRAGLALAGAMLFHQLASLFYPAALAAILANPNIQKRGRFALGLSAARGVRPYWLITSAPACCMTLKTQWALFDGRYQIRAGCRLHATPCEESHSCCAAISI